MGFTAFGLAMHHDGSSSGFSCSTVEHKNYTDIQHKRRLADDPHPPKLNICMAVELRKCQNESHPEPTTTPYLLRHSLPCCTLSSLFSVIHLYSPLLTHDTFQVD